MGVTSSQVPCGPHLHPSCGPGTVTTEHPVGRAPDYKAGSLYSHGRAVVGIPAPTPASVKPHFLRVYEAAFLPHAVEQSS